MTLIRAQIVNKVQPLMTQPTAAAAAEVVGVGVDLPAPRTARPAMLVMIFPPMNRQRLPKGSSRQRLTPPMMSTMIPPMMDRGRRAPQLAAAAAAAARVRMHPENQTTPSTPWCAFEKVVRVRLRPHRGRDQRDLRQSASDDAMAAMLVAVEHQF